jgi:PAS domain S-box-containing protein
MDSLDTSAIAFQLAAQLRLERAERERLQSELALRNFALDAARTHFLISEIAAGQESKVVYVNRAIAEDHGYDPAELLGTSPATLSPADLNPVQIEEIGRAIRAGSSARVELRARRKDGSVFWAGISLAPIRDAAGHVTHYVSIGADITSRLEEAQEKRRLHDRLYSEMQERERIAIELRFAQKLEAVGRLAAGIAHEINTPIQYVGDSVTFLRSSISEIESLLLTYRRAYDDLSQGRSKEEVLSQLARVETCADEQFLKAELGRACDRALDGVSCVARIVGAMKEFAHPDVTEHFPADLNHAIETTLIVARSEYKYTATVETQFGTIPEVFCNVGELNQVLLNLIVNAAHAIEHAGKDAATGRITLSTALAGPCVEITIADNGCGIAEENLEKIFDPFFTTKEVGKGTGQGLAIARSIVVDKHGGAINVQSAPGEGSRFRLRLPIAGRSKWRAA